MRHIWWVSAAFLLAFVSLARAADSAPSLSPDDAILGKPDAPITIFEYASLTCPHCAEFDAETLPKVKSEWLDTGKAKLIFRDFPLDKYALKAAMVARCAPPDRFFTFIDVLFHTQVSWATAGSDDGVTQALSKIARLGGISEDKFDACLNDKALLDRISGEELTAKNDYGVNSTPTFFINGKKVVGALPYDDFAKALVAAQANAGTQHFAAITTHTRE
ncbi:MAG TPA: DsbA family protein [Stellaceae bacterium]|nr:DsbA family protein [Stellaceae bacterium]